MRIELTFKSSHCVEWPAIKIIVNNCVELISNPLAEPSLLTAEFAMPRESNFIALEYYNKKPEHTLLKNHNIVEDQCIKLVNLRIDDIQIEPWLWNQGTYCPRYFSGFLDQFPDAPQSLIGELHWFFPGTYTIGPWPNEQEFWFWYRDRRREIVKTFCNHDLDSDIEKYIGSLNDYSIEIDRIKKIINV